MPKLRIEGVTHVRIKEHDGVPVRTLVKFGTGDLVPGKVLEVSASQALKAIAQGTVEPVSPQAVRVAAEATQTANPKPRRKKAPPADPAPSDEDFME